jgi:hypothetical protein
MKSNILGRAGVKCGEETHYAIIRDRGAVTLVNHPGKPGKAARVVNDQLSGTVCGCSQFLTSFKRKVKAYEWSSSAGEFPFYTWKHVRDARNQTRPAAGPPMVEQRKRKEILSSKLLDSATHALSSTVIGNVSLYMLDYSPLYSHPIPKDYLIRKPTQVVSSYKQKKVKSRTEEFSTYVVCVSPKQWGKIMLNKCTVVSGHMVVEILDSSDPQVWLVNALKMTDSEQPSQIRGRKPFTDRTITMEKAWIARTSIDKPWHYLQWDDAE